MARRVPEAALEIPALITANAFPVIATVVGVQSPVPAMQHAAAPIIASIRPREIGVFHFAKTIWIARYIQEQHVKLVRTRMG
jgi:hypothetical protein